jgi:diguanylate cyclase (GGDEF)-like protein
MKYALVIDDSPIELLMGKTLLERMGFTVVTASHGEEAMRLIQETAVNLVLCDIEMPGMSGLELLERTRDFAQPPVFIMSTSLDDAEHAVDAMQRGASGYLAKPLSEEILRNTVEDALARQEKAAEARRQLDAIARIDPLTGLLNKDEFLRQLSLNVGSLRKRDHPSALLFVNVDGMRYINNTYGQQEGDVALQHVAGVLQKSTRPNDFSGRFTGDVFAVHLGGIAPQDVEPYAQRLLDTIDGAKIQLGGNPHSLTVTIGVAICLPDCAMDDLINNADFALHLAKRQGRNRCYLYHEQDKEQQRELGVQLNSLEIVKRALDERRFEMHYQPIVDLSNGEVRHYEALIRMFDDDGKMLPPANLIKTAETFGLVNRLDAMVVSACLKKLEALAAEGNSAGLAINLSGKSVGDPGLLDLIQHELSSRRIDPAKVTFEITETALFHNLEDVQRFVQRLKKLGCKLALDDFGVGFSSFYYIKQLDIDYLKIDGSFVKNLPNSLNDQVFVRAMVEISRVFDMKVIAEWVENREVMDLLKVYGVDYGQGYFFGKPAPIIGAA